MAIGQHSPLAKKMPLQCEQTAQRGFLYFENQSRLCNLDLVCVSYAIAICACALRVIIVLFVFSNQNKADLKKDLGNLQLQIESPISFFS